MRAFFGEEFGGRGSHVVIGLRDDHAFVGKSVHRVCVLTRVNWVVSMRGTLVTQLNDDDWAKTFDRMVHPLHRLTRAVLPQMQERKRGKIIVYGSATALKGLKTVAAYSAARAAQVGYVQSVGVEVAPDNIQVNLIAQNYVENPVYYPPELKDNERFQTSLRRQVPLGRLATAREDAQFALFLASDESDFFVGQAIPFSGGWIQR